MRIEIVHARPDGADVVEIRLVAGATVREALLAAGIAGVDPERVGIFGRRVSADTRLADGDRVEIYRPLRLDPKEARRRRVTRNGSARRR